MYGFKILCEISKIPFEISHRILNPYTIEYVFYKVSKVNNSFMCHPYEVIHVITKLNNINVYKIIYWHSLYVIHINYFKQTQQTHFQLSACKTHNGSCDRNQFSKRATNRCFPKTVRNPSCSECIWHKILRDIICVRNEKLSLFKFRISARKSFGRTYSVWQQKLIGYSMISSRDGGY